MKANYLIILVLIFFTCCNTKLNQYEKFENKQRRVGKWIEKDSVNDGLYVIKGHYKHGEKVGIWKTYFNQKLYLKDKIKDSITKTKIYFPTGRVMEKGESKLIINKDFRHWFYFGEWDYYDDKGKIKYKKIYKVNEKADSISYQNSNR